ncbi:MAG: hypothetical protein B7Z74_09455, partial [Deltaproteobacteria bacterium 21-66-5]
MGERHREAGDAVSDEDVEVVERGGLDPHADLPRPGGRFRKSDAIASLVVAAVMLRSAWSLLRASGRILLEAAPEGTNVEEIGRALAG